jgi:hypothetical protein
VTVAAAPQPHPVLDAVARAACELTGAAYVAIVGVRGEEAVVLAVAGAEPQRTAGDVLRPGDDALAFVLACGQALSLAPPPAATAAGGAPGVVPAMCIPCLGPEGVTGALELRGRSGAGTFDPVATRAAAVLAEIVTAELERAPDADGADGRRPPAAPAELAAALAALARRDRERYARLARALDALLADA